MTLAAITRAAPLDFVPTEYEEALAKAYAKKHGFVGVVGGWIYRAEPDERPWRQGKLRPKGHAITQGWHNFYSLKKVAILDELTRELTASRTFAEFTHPTAHGRTYRPTLLVLSPRDWRADALACAYDSVRASQKDLRRPHPGHRARPGGRLMPRPRAPIIERFLAQIEVEPLSGCWLWTGALAPNGYARLSAGGHHGASLQAYRWIYEQRRGPIPADLEVDHVSRVKRCVNPDHLEVVTGAENKRRARKTHCARGHALADPNLIYRRDGSRASRACASARRKERKPLPMSAPVYPGTPVRVYRNLKRDCWSVQAKARNGRGNRHQWYTMAWFASLTLRTLHLPGLRARPAARHRQSSEERPQLRLRHAPGRGRRARRLPPGERHPGGLQPLQVRPLLPP